MFNNNFYDDQEPPPPPPHSKGPARLRPSLHAAQMDALTDVHGGGLSGLDTRKITGLGIALCTDDPWIRRYLARLG